MAARITKAKAVAPVALQALGVMAEFHGWSKRGPRGKRKVWTLRRLRPDGTEIA